MAAKSLTIQDFFRQFPNDDACLDHLFKVRFGENPKCSRCGQRGKFRRLTGMPAYTCNCGNHIHPMVDTPFLRTRTPLQKWFFAIFMFTTTRNGVAAKELQRQLGVTYKTAWRMARLIREYMGEVDGDAPLGGTGNVVEADELFVGGRDKKGREDKAIVFGMAERKGEVITRVVRNRSEDSLIPHIARHVRPGSRVSTDDWLGYRNVRDEGFDHSTVNHSAEEWVRGDTHTNTIEAFWAMVRRTIAGTHIWVSRKHLPTYLREIEYRWNLRHSPHLLFPLLMASFQRPSA